MSAVTLHGVEITVRGTVQGVGFRPFVYRLARKLHLFGSILNSDQGVVIRLEGSASALQSFLETLHTSPPPLARISSITRQHIKKLKGFTRFTIAKSLAGSKSRAIIPADIASCKNCLQDVADPENRRFCYPFTNCTNCGPRYSIVTNIPYDRPGTSMDSFPLCEDCRTEYEDPENRRFHAQPNACPVCGPKLSYHDANGKPVPVDSALQAVTKDLQRGKIVAIRGLGGFHLVVDAYSETAIGRLRKRKGRKNKPLAVMAADITEARSFCTLTARDEELLLGIEHPIVLVSLKKNRLPPSLTPNISEIGLMLPYTPLHQLLFQEKNCPRTLVMTSGNRSGAPIFTANDTALKGLQSITDTFLLHNREIVTRVDDSVVRSNPRGMMILRRSRGYVPSATRLPRSLPYILACGAGLKATFCLTRENEAFVSQHIGDLFDLESLDFYTESIYHFTKLLQVKPELVVCDLHPDYLSSQYAEKTGLPLYKVQHHHAHVAAVLAEHRIEEKVLAVILDGSGLGDDKRLWGGEVLIADYREYKRVGSLSPMLLPGGDAAAENPWRMALSLLQHAGFPVETAGDSDYNHAAVWQLMKTGFNCPPTTSCGRLFDGVAALLGICREMDYEGQAAMELESLAKEAMKTKTVAGLLNNFDFSASHRKENGRLVLQQGEITSRIVEQLGAGGNIATIALDFHLALIRSFFSLTCALGEKTGLQTVVLTGGCMQNTILLEGLFVLLEEAGYKVFTGEKIPVNDGGIALGQAIIGGLAHVSGSTHESP